MYLVIILGQVSAHPLQGIFAGGPLARCPIDTYEHFQFSALEELHPLCHLTSKSLAAISHSAFPLPFGQADHVATIQVVPSLSPSGRNRACVSNLL
jgi:hypothetical protein